MLESSLFPPLSQIMKSKTMLSHKSAAVNIQSRIYMDKMN
jgi:hypothetical protein